MGRWWIQSRLYLPGVTSLIASTAVRSTIWLFSDNSYEPIFSALEIMRSYGFSHRGSRGTSTVHHRTNKSLHRPHSSSANGKENVIPPYNPTRRPSPNKRKKSRDAGNVQAREPWKAHQSMSPKPNRLRLKRNRDLIRAQSSLIGRPPRSLSKRYHHDPLKRPYRSPAALVLVSRISRSFVPSSHADEDETPRMQNDC